MDNAATLAGMNVTRQVLLETTTTAIEKYTAARTEYDKGAKKWRERATTRENADALERQKRCRDAMSAGLKSKKPLTVDQIRDALGGRSYFSDLAVRSVGDPPRRFVLDGVTYERPSSVPLEDLKALKTTLESVLEETISDGQLQRLGFKNMGWVFRAAVANGGQVAA